MLRQFALNTQERSIMLISQMNELLGDLLLEIKLRIKPLQRRQRSLKRFQSLAVFFGRIARELRVILRNRAAYFFALFPQSRQNFYVTLTTLDFLVQNDAVESLPAFGEFLGKIEMGARSEAETVDVFLHDIFRFLDPL